VSANILYYTKVILIYFSLSNTFYSNLRLCNRNTCKMLSAKENKLTVEQIIKGCRAQDIEMQKAFYQLHGPMLMGVCMRYLKPKENAEEVFHDVVLKIFDKIDKYNGNGSFLGWCRRLTVNSCLDYLRKHKNQLRLNYIEDQQIEIEDTVDDSALLENAKLEDVVKLIDDLPEHQQVVLNLFIMDGYSHKKIGERKV
jgi:RNA polymerase sigma factor (sigma-70 family)